MRVDDINDGSSLRFQGIVLFGVASVLFSIGGDSGNWPETEG